MTAKGTKFIKVAISPDQAASWLQDRGRMHHDMTESIINQVKKEFPNLLSEREREYQEYRNAQDIVIKSCNSPEAVKIIQGYQVQIDLIQRGIQNLINQRDAQLKIISDRALKAANITNYESDLHYRGVIKCDAENAAKNTSSNPNTATAADSTGQSPNGSDLPKDNPPNG